MKPDQFSKLLTFLRQLQDAHIHHELAHYRDDAISVRITVPGERWEVDFLDDGDVDVERFVGDGRIGDETTFAELFAKFSDREPATSHESPARK